MTHVVRLEECGTAEFDRVGGKAAGLGALCSNGFRVPPGYAVTTDAYREFVEGTGIVTEIDRLLARAGDSTAANQEASERIRELFLESAVSSDVSSEIVSAYRTLGEAVPVAVRSSATAEDTEDASFAGQQETYLWIRGPEAVTRKVLECWASLFTPQAITYRSRLGIGLDEAAMGVVVQEMVPAEAAGVMLTLDPVTGDRSQISIESCFGLGVGVVGGDIDPDRFAVDKVTFDLRSREIVTKPKAYHFDPARGEVVLARTPEARRGEPSITDEQVLELARLGKRIERELGRPQDIEWAIGQCAAGHGVYLLQTRPETVWSRKKRRVARAGMSLMDQILHTIHHPDPSRGSPGG